jgi:hypothetical protein
MSEIQGHSNPPITSLGDRLIPHYERQLSFYEEQREKALEMLMRLKLSYSNQLQLENWEEVCSVNTSV